MNKSPIKSVVQRLTNACCVLVTLAACVYADQGPLGQWDLKAEFGGRTNESTLSIDKAGEQLKGKINSERGERELDDVTFTDGLLEFDMTIDAQGQQMTLHFSGKIKDDALTGSWSSDFGEFPVAGTRGVEKASAVGTWKLMVDSPLGNNPRELVIKPDMTGTYGGGDLPAFPIENVNLDGATAAMEVTLKSDQGELPCTVRLKFDGDKVTGSLDYGDGEATIVGERGKNPLVGTWKLIVNSQLGENEHELVIKPDMSGTYGGGDFENFPVSNVKVDGNTATMDVALELQGQAFPVTIKLKIEGDKVTGNLDYGQGDASIEGKRE